MPRALTREEQAILALVRRTDAAMPVPELAVRLNLAVPVAQAACEYLVSRGLLRASVYAVEAPVGAKHQPAASRSGGSGADQPRVPERRFPEAHGPTEGAADAGAGGRH